MGIPGLNGTHKYKLFFSIFRKSKKNYPGYK